MDLVREEAEVELSSSFKEQDRIWKMAHERVLKEMEHVKTTLEEEKSTRLDASQAVEHKLKSQAENQQVLDNRLTNVEKKWKQLRQEGPR